MPDAKGERIPEDERYERWRLFFANQRTSPRLRAMKRARGAPLGPADLRAERLAARRAAARPK